MTSRQNDSFIGGGATGDNQPTGREQEPCSQGEADWYDSDRPPRSGGDISSRIIEITDGVLPGKDDTDEQDERGELISR